MWYFLFLRKGRGLAMNVCTFDSSFYDYKQKWCEVVKLTETIIKTTPIVMYIQSLLLGCNRVKFTEVWNQPGDSSSCRKSVGGGKVSYPWGFIIYGVVKGGGILMQIN